MNLEEFITFHTSLCEASEIIFYGGSFNPWHEGHSSCLRLVPSDVPVVVIPDHNPFKNLIDHNDKVSSLEDLKEKVSSFKNKSFVFDQFAKANTKNPTHTWFLGLADAFPNKKLSLLMGFDTFITIDRWINADELLQKISTLYVVDRLNDESLKRDQINRLGHYKNLKVVFLGEHPYEDLSSTSIRKNLNPSQK